MTQPSPQYSTSEDAKASALCSVNLVAVVEQIAGFTVYILYASKTDRHFKGKSRKK